MIALFFSILISIFSVANPLGAVPIFVGLTSDDDIKTQQQIARKTSIYMFIILMVSFFVGSQVLAFFGISINSLRIAGGLIIVSSGFALLSGKFAKNRGVNQKVKEEAMEKDDISLTPMAIPMLSGPGTISLLIGYSQKYFDIKNFDNIDITSIVVIILAVLCTAILTFFVLSSAKYLAKVLGATGLNALSRIIGFLVVSIGIQYISIATTDILSHIKSAL